MDLEICRSSDVWYRARVSSSFMGGMAGGGQVKSIAPKIGCVPQTLNDWVKKAEVDSGQRPGTTTADAQRIKELEREVKELRRANDILKTASAFFAQAELDRRLKS
jgi:transposase-like protein